MQSYVIKLPTVKSMHYREGPAALCMEGFLQRAQAIGTTSPKAALRKNVSDPWKPMPTLSS